eukprot:6901-Heterococcus_DN1.PRE.2
MKASVVFVALLLDAVCSFYVHPHVQPSKVVHYGRTTAVRSTALAAAGVETSEQTTLRYKRLQNQSDIRGISIAGVPGEDLSLGPVEAHFIGAAFAVWLHKQVAKGGNEKVTISVGRDCRLSGEEISMALMSGMTRNSINTAVTADHTHVVDVGPCTTPVMVTASHLPMNRNGLKFFTKAGGLDKTAIAEIVATSAELCNAAKESSSSTSSIGDLQLNLKPGAYTIYDHTQI